MKKLTKILLLTGLSSVMFCTTAFAAENDIVAVNDVNNQVTIAPAISTTSAITNIETTVTPTPVTPTPVAAPTVTKGLVTANILNVRSGPSTDKAILGKLSIGSTVEIISNVGGWYQIKFGTQTAYVFGEYINLNITTSRGGTFRTADASTEGSEIVAYAKKFIGVPYVYGGTTPSGFDCSGFTKYVMAHFGYDLPHPSSDQYACGTRVLKSQLMPGDLVFFKYSGASRIGHVGIYVGDGKFIHSPIPGQSVKIDSLSYGYFANYYYGAIRASK